MARVVFDPESEARTRRKLDADLPRLDMRSPGLATRQSIQKFERRRHEGWQGRGQGLLVSLSSDLAARVRAAAEKHGALPQTFAAALIAQAFAECVVDELMEGCATEIAAGGQGRNAAGLTLIQCAVVHLVAMHSDAEGVCRLSTYRLAALMPKGTPSGVASALAMMAGAGFLERGPLVERVRTWRLTDKGRTLARELGGQP